MGVPCVLSKREVGRVIELDLNRDERALFKASADRVPADTDRIRQ